ncbi:lipase 3-like [Ostrinia furnacalis]|uniref:lipase 3-like n=1 Tax=Ostrinia furnacalis TaxID=93504 RepID=UPI00103E454A|nr:lipase 3-like [Ostrinia furnacalis]
MSQKLIICAVLIISQFLPNNGYALDDFFKEQTDVMNTFFKNQFQRVEQAVNTQYDEAVKVQTKVKDYIEEQKKKISDDVNNYVDKVKDNGRYFVDTWSFMPTEDPESRLVNPDLVLSVPSIISRNGYNCETHTILSKGYLLNVHRIPRPKHGGQIPKKTVLLQHGLFASSADWIMNGPEKSLGYILADAGYDVWMTNIRGNKYSKEHAWYKENTKEYWNFSWNEVALYDIPAVIDYIRNIKGEDTKIAYVGHSMGTTILFTMLSLRPEYNDKLSVGVALAPEVFISNMKSPIKSLASIASHLAHTEMIYGAHEFLPKKSFLGRMNKMCEAENMDVSVCNNVVFYICGADEEQYNKTLLPFFLSNLGTGTSWKTALHMSQMVLAEKFQQFDYGYAERNQRIYGSDNPPEYDLSKVTLNVTLFWAKNDLLSDERDVMKLHERLPHSTLYLVPFEKFNHMDYLWAKDAPRLVNDKVMEVLNKAMDTENRNVFFSFIF